MIFEYPMEMSPSTALSLVLPLCATVAVVYKAVRVKTLRQLPLQILWLWLYIFAGLVVLSVVFYLLQVWT